MKILFAPLNRSIVSIISLMNSVILDARVLHFPMDDQMMRGIVCDSVIFKQTTAKLL